MSKIADKKFEILGYVNSGEYSVSGLADKLNELTRLVENLPLHFVMCEEHNKQDRNIFKTSKGDLKRGN